MLYPKVVVSQIGIRAWLIRQRKHFMESTGKKLYYRHTLKTTRLPSFQIVCENF